MRSLAGFLLLLFAADVVAQPRWEVFPAQESSLVFSAPDMPDQPSKAQELRGGSPGTRVFNYTWGKPLAPAAYAQVIVNQLVQNGKAYTRPPDYPKLLVDVFSHVKSANPEFGESESDAAAALGPLKFRTMALGSRDCLAFGGIFGVMAGGMAFAGGAVPKGDHWIYGLYCPPAGSRLSSEGARYIMEGFGWKGIGMAQPGRAKPAEITALN